jgi:hypothetical protein
VSGSAADHDGDLAGRLTDPHHATFDREYPVAVEVAEPGQKVLTEGLRVVIESRHRLIPLFMRLGM